MSKGYRKQFHWEQPSDKIHPGYIIFAATWLGGDGPGSEAAWRHFKRGWMAALAWCPE